jgi:glycosyltransferase involved in cell wall biosynthesis
MFHQYAKALRKRGIDARIFFADFNPDSPFKKAEVNFSDEESVPTWRMYQWFPPKFHSILINLWIKKYVRAIQAYIEKEGKPDLIHAQSYLSGIIASALFEKSAIPFIITERLSSFVTGQIPVRYKSLIKKSFDEASQVTCVSPGLKKYLQLHTSKIIEVVPNFFDPSVFYHDPSIPKNETFTWVSVGEPSKTKGLDTLMHAFGKVRKKIPSEKMQLIMIDEIREKEDLIRIARQYQVEDEIIWTGLISQPEIADILRRSHALVSASRVETFGKSILEAQACGLPVLATKTDGARYILSNAEQGILISNNDVDSLANGLQEMLMNYRNYSAEKIITSVNKFKEEVVIAQWLDIYNKVAS